MRQIVLDTETTGLKPEAGHKIIEIGCIELVNRQFTGKHWQAYLNPERAIDEGALRVHGISQAMLANKPIFAEIVDDFMTFVAGAELIIHNAPFDMGFLAHEFHKARRNFNPIAEGSIIDTLLLARQRHPGQRNSLDALCKRYHVDNSHREFHGALLDARILAEVYLAMTGGQTSLFGDLKFAAQPANAEKKSLLGTEVAESLLNSVIEPNAEELAAHQAYLDILEKQSGKVGSWEE